MIRKAALLILVTAFCIVGVGFSTSANATLTDNGGGLIYDPGLNVTFYDYRYAGPTGGGTTLSQALVWANGLTAGGVSGWRLPTTNVLATAMYNVGEMGELYHVQLGLNGTTVTGNQLPFTTLLPNFYWTSTFSRTTTSGNIYYDFEFDVGRQMDSLETSQLYALAVHDGNVGGSITTTPEPATMLLLGLGLIGMAGVRRFKK